MWIYLLVGTLRFAHPTLTGNGVITINVVVLGWAIVSLFPYKTQGFNTSPVLAL
jgi:hypothetical protein